MKTPYITIIAAAIFLMPLSALADERGHGKHRHNHREYKEEYWDGHCKVERKLKKNGDYKEKRKCKAPRHHEAMPAYAPAPVYVPAPVAPPGVVIQGTVRVR